MNLARPTAPGTPATGRARELRYPVRQLWTPSRQSALPDQLPVTPAAQPGRSESADRLPIGDAQHPLADHALGQLLQQRAARIGAAFDAIEPLLRELAKTQFSTGFEQLAQATLSERLGIEIPADLLSSRWNAAIDMRRLHARCVMETFSRLVDEDFKRQIAAVQAEESLDQLIRRWGFHAVDISACADGRLSGMLDYILRIPAGVVIHRRSHAGAMFDIEQSLRHWEEIELRRWRSAWPNAAGESTRYLKIGVYHFSGADPDHAGCAAHGSDARLAASRLLERLEQFAMTVQKLHGACPATLLVGIDTDTDAIRVHVPDAEGRISITRAIDNVELHAATRALGREAAKDAIRAAVAACAGVHADHPGSSGMRWLCAYLLKNNLGQYDAVRALPGGRYADAGHTERLIVVGDAIDAVQLRNLAFQAQMDTVEEGAHDLDVGIGILRAIHEPRGLGVPVLVHCAHRADLPGAAARASARAVRLQAAVAARHADLAARGVLQIHAVTLPLAQLAAYPRPLPAAARFPLEEASS